MGRRKIEIEPLTDDRNRTVTFVKRKAGLFKKAYELAVLCQVDIAVIIVGNNQKVYEFSSVDTKELLKAYKSVKKPQESKSPANYGNYKKKRTLSLRNLTTDENNLSVDEDNDSEYDSETPEPKRKKLPKANDEGGAVPMPMNNYDHTDAQGNSHLRHTVPPFNIKRNDVRSNLSPKKELSMSKMSTGSQRPVLRVQIPSNVKESGNDSARTITALDTNVHHPDNAVNTDSVDYSKGGDPSSASTTSGGAPNINALKYSGFNTFKSPDSRKPTLPIPINNKSQTSSPLSATAPQMPISGLSSFFGQLPQPSPSTQFLSNSMLPTSLLSQVFNQQPINSSQQQGSQGIQAPPENQNFLNGNMHGKLRLTTQGNNVGLVNNPGEQTPFSGLPSRYIGDMFPSPSNLYVMQDWPNYSTGMTPINTSMPHYFMSLNPGIGNSAKSGTYQVPNQANLSQKGDGSTSPLININSFPNANSNAATNTTLQNESSSGVNNGGENIISENGGKGQSSPITSRANS